jgi:hypothetical protein
VTFEKFPAPQSVQVCTPEEVWKVPLSHSVQRSARFVETVPAEIDKKNNNAQTDSNAR